MLIEVCDVCNEPIAKISKETGAVEVTPDQPYVSFGIEPNVISTDGKGTNTGFSRRYVLCSTDCAQQFAHYMHLCFVNPKYKGVPVGDLMESFFKGELKPLTLVEKSGETENVGERNEQPREDPTADPNITRILEFTRTARESEPTNT